MLLDFYKYEGAGNDFILIDDRMGIFPKDRRDLVNRMCDRNFGIGGDGLMLLRSCAGYDFEMVYFNADGRESSLCGNGGRCIAAFARKLGIITNNARFLATDGEHLAELVTDDYVKLKMNDVSEIESGKGYYFLNTGSPHYVTFTTHLAELDVVAAGREIRNNDRFRSQGTNVNFVEDSSELLFVRTYERGVENETLACGTGVVASVITACLRRGGDKISYTVPVKVMGGLLQVSLKRNGSAFTDIWLDGPATYVFRGQTEIR
jgi:diaminopimelate epimerase